MADSAERDVTKSTHVRESVAADSTASLRLWPAYLILLLQAAALILSVTPSINNVTRFGYMMLGPLVAALFFLVWLLLFSRLPWRERLAVPAVVAVVLMIASYTIHASMGVALLIYGVPVTLLVVTLGFLRCRRKTSRIRLGTVTLLLCLGFGVSPLLRLDGFTGNYLPEMAWRWSPTAEESLEERDPLLNRRNADEDGESWQASSVEWKGFRGNRGDSRVTGFTPALDWDSSPQQERWRIQIGPAWSSFAYVSGRLFTQEQRGEFEVVSCLDAADGGVVWRHAVESRFTEIVSGAGPRATPTFADGRLFAMGGKAVLSALDAADGTVVWQRDLAAELGAEIPMWGCSSSPLVVDENVIVYVDGDAENGLIAFDASTGEIVWNSNIHGMNYSSAQLVQFAGQDLLLFVDGEGLRGIEPTTGETLWRYSPLDWQGPSMVQPQKIGAESVLVALGDGRGLARVEVINKDGTWHCEETWSSNRLKPSFNDFVYHDGFIYGFDQNIFTCVDASTGERRWKQGRYGFGQVVLLEDASQLIVASESGELVLLAADPAGHVEQGRLSALEGKTWNHPIVADGHLFHRNGNEAICFRLGAE
jgi:outer membrane protein assembly factor BamB